MSTSGRAGLRRLARITAAGAVALGAIALVVPTAGAAQPTSPPATGAHAVHQGVPAGAVPVSGPVPAAGRHGNWFDPATRGAARPNIIGGSPVDSSAYPGVVGIISFTPDPSDPGEDFAVFCTGTVVSPTKVLTAGHCDTDLGGAFTIVLAGTNNILAAANGDLTNGFVDGVTATATDPQYNLAALNANPATVPVHDVSVLTLSVPLPSVYPPVTLTAQGDQSVYSAGHSATIVGYGATQPTDSSSFGLLEAATGVPVQNDATCSTAEGGYDAATMTCAGFPAGGVDTCNGDSGGPLFVNGVEAGITDWGTGACAQAGTYGVYERLSAYHSLVQAGITEPTAANLDFTGDGHSDLLVRDQSGNLIDYPGSGFADDGFGGFTGTVRIGQGWGGFTHVMRVTNWHGDGTESVLAESGNGNLYEYDTDGAGDWTNPNGILIGTAWNSFSDIMVVDNWTGDGHEDLIGRTPGGALRLYESNGNGGWVNPAGTQIGTGWNIFNTVLTPGAWTGDGHQALIGRTTGGALRLYESDQHGGWVNTTGTQIGTDWNMFSTFFSPGDWSGDGLVDLIGVTPAGNMAMYTTDGHGNWINATGEQIGHGFQIATAIF